jgi:hypothetical protein
MNSKKAMCALALTAGAILPGAAYSQLITSSYFGGQLGSSDSREFCEKRVGPCDKTGTAWRIYSGLGFTRNFGVEIGIVDLGQFTHTDPGTGTSTKTETILSEALAVFTYSAQRVSIFGKVGGFYGGTKANVQTGAVTVNANESTTGLTYGAGAKYEISSRFAVRGDWQHYAKVGGTDTGGEANVNAFLVGLEWRFR